MPFLLPLKIAGHQCLNQDGIAGASSESSDSEGDSDDDKDSISDADLDAVLDQCAAEASALLHRFPVQSRVNTEASGIFQSMPLSRPGY